MLQLNRWYELKNNLKTFLKLTVKSPTGKEEGVVKEYKNKIETLRLNVKNRKLI